MRNILCNIIPKNIPIKNIIKILSQRGVEKGYLLFTRYPINIDIPKTESTSKTDIFKTFGFLK